MNISDKIRKIAGNCCGGQKLRSNEEIQSTKWKALPTGWTEKSREKFWNSLVGDAEHKRTVCHDKMMGWIKDDKRAWAYCQSLWDEFENK